MHTFKSRKLNLGCGFDKRPDFINVDVLVDHKPDVLADASDLRDFPSCYFEEIVAQDILEHFKRIDTRRCLYEWNRLLALGGTIFIRTTYLNGLIRKLDAPQFQSIEGQELLIHSLFSTQIAEGDFHLTSFSESLFRYYLWECGFDIVEIRVRDEWLFEATSRKVTDYSFEELVRHSRDDETFLRRLYREAVFREPDEAGFNLFRDALRDKKLSRRDVVRMVLMSDERKKKMIARAPKFPCVFGVRRAA